MTLELFPFGDIGERTTLGRNAFLLHGFALPYSDRLLPAIDHIQTQAPFQHLVTPGGHVMSVALSNCGKLGWTTNEQGYCYTEVNPHTQRPWPAMPAVFRELAAAAASAAGFDGFAPDACLVNRYLPGSRLTLHQDKNERDLSAPIVSVSLGMSAVFLFGGFERSDKTVRVPLKHGDVVVWGGEDRMRYHGVMPVPDAPHPLLGSQRINFTFRKVI